MTLPSHAREQPAVTVTTARLSHTDDITLRERRYVATQMVRVACVVLGVALPVPVLFRLLLFVGAVVLPWFGVVMANAGPTVARRRKTAIVDSGLASTIPEPPLRLAIDPGRVVDAER
jgi:hypothetical protein